MPIASQVDLITRDSTGYGSGSYGIDESRITSIPVDPLTVGGRTVRNVKNVLLYISQSYDSDGILTSSDSTWDHVYWSPDLGFITRVEWKNHGIIDSLISFTIK